MFAPSMMSSAGGHDDTGRRAAGYLGSGGHDGPQLVAITADGSGSQSGSRCAALPSLNRLRRAFESPRLAATGRWSATSSKRPAFPDTEEVTGSIPVPPTSSTSENSPARVAIRGPWGTIRGTIGPHAGSDKSVALSPTVASHPAALASAEDELVGWERDR